MRGGDTAEETPQLREKVWGRNAMSQKKELVVWVAVDEGG